MERLSSSQKNRIAQGIFLVAFIAEILIRCISSTGIEIPYRTRLLQLIAVLFGVKILLTKYCPKEWCIIAVTAVLTMIPFVTIRETLWVEIAMMLIAAKDVNRNQLLKNYFYILLTSMILMALLAAFGVMGELAIVKDFDRGGVETRYCFGFSHPNVFYSNLLNLIAIGMCVFHEKMKGWHFVLLTVLNCFFMGLSASRTGFIVVQVLIIAMFIVKMWPQIVRNRFVYGFGYVCISMAVLLSYCVYFIDYPFLKRVDDLLTGRLRLTIERAPITEWQLFAVARDSVVLDMGFVNVMYYWGVILGVVYILLIFWNYRQFYLRKDYAAIVILLCYTLFSMIESHAFSMYFVGNLMFVLMLGWGKECCNVSEKKSDS